MAEQPHIPVSSSDTSSPSTTGLLSERVEEHPISDAASAAVGTAHTLQPGTKCPTCERRVNHPKKTDSPTSKGRTYKVPADELQAHDEILDAAAEHIGAAGTPFANFKTITAALVCLLQDEGAKGLHGELA